MDSSPEFSPHGSCSLARNHRLSIESKKGASIETKNKGAGPWTMVLDVPVSFYDPLIADTLESSSVGLLALGAVTTAES